MTGGGLSSYAPARRTRSRWVGRAAVLPTSPFAPQWLKFVVLTVSMLGLQLVWSCEMAQASPYLLSLGVSKSMMSVVFVAGPLSGLIVQPIVGVLSDGCRSSLGRRRPFIIAGCVVSSFAVVLLGWAAEIAAWIFTPGQSLHSRLTIALAVLSIYLIDFSINVVQAMDRALLVDVIAPALQPAANAWSSRMFGFGAVFGFWFGGLDLVYWTNGYLGKDQLKVICFFTAFFLCGCHAITVACVQERVLISREDDRSPIDGNPAGTMKALEDIWTTMRTLPKPIQDVVNIQFTSWLGWFPVLFFSTTWVAEIYMKSTGEVSSDLGSASADVRDKATRAGTRAMLFHSIVSLATSILLPPMIASDSSSPHLSTPQFRHPRSGDNFLSRLVALWFKFKPTLPLPWLSLPLLWTISNALFSVLLLSTYFASSVFGASFIIASLGFCWAVGNWVPFALLGELILSLGANSQPAIQLETSLADHSIVEWAESRPSLDAHAPPDHNRPYEDYDDKTPTLARPGAGFAHSTPPAHSRSRASTTSTMGNESPGTPMSATSAYFEAVMETPDPDQAFLPPTPSPPHSPAKADIPTLTVTPPRRIEAPRPLLPNAFESRRGSHIDVDLFASHPYEYPLHTDEAASQLTFFAGGSTRTISDPVGGGARSGTGTPLMRRGSTSPMKVLQVRNSDDSFSRSSLESSEEVQTREEEAMEGKQGSRRGSAMDGHAANGAAPTIMVGEVNDSREYERRLEDESEDEMDNEDEDDADGAADQAGVILGIHNIYLVLPQFLVTALSSVVFAMFAPHHSVVAHGSGSTTTHPVVAPPPTLNTTTTDPLLGLTGGGIDDLRSRALSTAIDLLIARAEQEGAPEAQWDALGIIFRFGGVMAAVSALLAWKMTRWRERERTRTALRASSMG